MPETCSTSPGRSKRTGKGKDPNQEAVRKCRFWTAKSRTERRAASSATLTTIPSTLLHDEMYKVGEGGPTLPPGTRPAGKNSFSMHRLQNGNAQKEQHAIIAIQLVVRNSDHHVGANMAANASTCIQENDWREVQS